MQSLGSIINDEVFMIEHGYHAITEIHELPYLDFCMYVDTIYNKKVRELEEEEQAIKNQIKGSKIG